MPITYTLQGDRKLKELRSIVGYREKENDVDSWLNIQDEEDPRGRVGVSWPWERGDDKK